MLDLTPREYAAIRMLSRGSTVNDIADFYHVTPRAIRFNLTAAMKKRKAKTYPHLVAKWLNRPR
jgi:DNA-binding CsgD family transcriptional regulator